MGAKIYIHRNTKIGKEINKKGIKIKKKYGENNHHNHRHKHNYWTSK